MDEVQRTINSVSSSVGEFGRLFSGASGGNAMLGLMQKMLKKGASAAGGGTRSSGGNTINLVMNISTPSVDSFRKSQGQVMADAASALQRAMRNL